MKPGPCILKRLGDCDYMGRSADWHHIIPKQFLTDEQKASMANLVILCRRHHDHITNARIYLSEADLPHGFREFAKEVGQEARVDVVLGGRSGSGERA